MIYVLCETDIAQYPHLSEILKLFTGHESQNKFCYALEDIIKIFICALYLYLWGKRYSTVMILVPLLAPVLRILSSR